MDVIVLIGRILFAVVFLGSGVGHLTHSAPTIVYARARGVPAAKVAVLGSGMVLLAGGLMVLLGVWADLGALLLMAFLLPAALLTHPFWKESDAQAKQLEMTQFVKNVSLAGGALLIFALYAHSGNDLRLTVTGPLFHLG